MNTSSIVCVLRLVGKNDQWVLASGRTDIVNGETAKVGEFTSFTVAAGPSKSHVVTCYEPVANKTIDRVMRGCVVRFVGKSDEYVTMDGRFDLVNGETQVTGIVELDTYINDGPSGSNRVPVMRFVGDRHFGKVSISKATHSPAPNPTRSQPANSDQLRAA